MSGESKRLHTEMSLMNYQHARCMSSGSKMLMEQVLRIINMIGASQVKVNV